MITIVLADDHPIIRQGLRGILEAEKDILVVGEASDGLSTIQLVEKVQPNVLVVDISMPGLNGLDVTRQLNKHFPVMKIIIMSMHSNEAYVLKAIRNGASGYVLKASSTEDLVSAIRKVLRGDLFFSENIAKLGITQNITNTKTDDVEPYDMLTDREREVLHLAAEGLTSAEIAQRLYLSSRTVEMHRSNLMTKLGLKHQTDLVLFAIKQGVLNAE